MRLTVPGNLLLLGEYAVLEEGGLGFAAAVERRARVSAVEGPGLLIEGAWPGATLSWRPGSAPSHAFFAAAVAEVELWLRGAAVRTPEWNVHLRVDSAAFYSPQGRKLGFGSSAAVTVGVVYALLAAAGVPADARTRAASRISVAAHRTGQAGSASGYDVTCSLLGGTGIFTGGAAPGWTPCPLPYDAALLTYSGPAPVSSADSVRRYGEWKSRNAAPARDFLSESNEAVRRFALSRSAAEAGRWLESCRSLGVRLGKAIGVPAEIEVPEGLDPAWCKSLGAGNELGVCMAPRATSMLHDAGPSDDVRVVDVSERGVTWEE